MASDLNSVFLLSASSSSEKAIAPHSSTLAWKIPWTEEPCRLQSMGSQRVNITDQISTCPPPGSPQPGQVHLGNPRSPLKAERWEPSARLAENPAGPFTSFTAGPWASAVSPAGSSRQPDRPANAAHTPRHQRLRGPGLLSRPCPPAPPCQTPSWIRPGGPQQRRAKCAHHHGAQ